MDAPTQTHSTIEAAQRLRVSVQTVQRWVDAGHLKAWKTVGGHRRIDAASVSQFMQAQNVTVPQVPPPRLVPAAPERPLSVLVVDDVPMDLEILVHLVRTALPDADITAVASGFHALVAFGQRPRDIVIADIVMPNMNGIEMLQHMARDCDVQPRLVVAVSGHAQEEVAGIGDLPPSVEFVSKPIQDHQAFVQWLQGLVAAELRPSLLAA